MLCTDCKPLSSNPTKHSRLLANCKATRKLRLEYSGVKYRKMLENTEKGIDPFEAQRKMMEEWERLADELKEVAHFRGEQKDPW